MVAIVKERPNLYTHTYTILGPMTRGPHIGAHGVILEGLHDVEGLYVLFADHPGTQEQRHGGWPNQACKLYLDDGEVLYERQRVDMEGRDAWEERVKARRELYIMQVTELLGTAKALENEDKGRHASSTRCYEIYRSRWYNGVLIQTSANADFVKRVIDEKELPFLWQEEKPSWMHQSLMSR